MQNAKGKNNEAQILQLNTMCNFLCVPNSLEIYDDVKCVLMG